MISSRTMVSALIGLVLMFTTSVRAADAGITGTWKWTTTGQNNQTRETVVKLKQEGDKITGVYVGRNNTETPITDGTIKDNEVSFKVVRKMQDREFVTVYTGKLEGDTIKGKVKMGSGDQARERDWEAKRVKE